MDDGDAIDEDDEDQEGKDVVMEPVQRDQQAGSRPQAGRELLKSYK